MGLTNQERTNLNSKVLAAGVYDGVPTKQWYEALRANAFILEADQVYDKTHWDLVKANPASSLAVAQTLAAGTLSGIIDDLSAAASAVRLTPEIASNSFQYLALTTYNDFSSARLDKWILPQRVPQTNGQPSTGYAIQLYEGDPNAGGTLIGTSDGQTGSGNTASVGWVFNYDLGILIVSEDYKASITDPYILGFRYIGDTIADTAGGGGSGVDIEESYATVDDSTRSNKTLSITRPKFEAGDKRRVKNRYLSLSNGVSSYKTGYRMIRDATLVSGSIQTSETGTFTLHFRKNKEPTSLGSITVTANTFAKNQNLNIDLDEDDELQFYIEGTCYNPQVYVEVAWRF